MMIYSQNKIFPHIPYKRMCLDMRGRASLAFKSNNILCERSSCVAEINNDNFKSHLTLVQQTEDSEASVAGHALESVLEVEFFNILKFISIRYGVAEMFIGLF